jgi:hypothetical protein
VKGSENGAPQERLPERKDEILAPGARLKITLKERSGMREVEIPANHYHLDEDFWGTEKGSIPLVVYCREDGWPESDAGGGSTQAFVR